jgi:excisionase family DNA binding protein
VRLLSIEAAADILSISKWTVRAYIRTGKLRAVRLGRRVLVEENELEQFIARNRISTDMPVGEEKNPEASL